MPHDARHRLAESVETDETVHGDRVARPEGTSMHWQVQEAKQRFSALLRSVQDEGPQYVSKHGEDVAVVIAIEEYRHLQSRDAGVKDLLLDPMGRDDMFAEALEQVVAERGYPRDLGFPLEIDTTEEQKEPGTR
ncbi:type II toxin-antitoxin system Phd/YefM family antitoxin [Nocardiopsis halophila]|uniref:type II toxin-antitoxin system Phd/YefM family antitoxin n=1 Tax=Nocardiopsis halophila TaxID=141692 RepID=UPI001F4D091B|nr:type II toxin-antitoxin system Phd/YefM family antitoxin [Nocardiopsis halophila]